MSSSPAPGRQVGTTALVFILWMLSLALGLYAIYAPIQCLRCMPSRGREQSVAGLLRWIAPAVGAIAWIIAMLAGGEYHLKHAGERRLADLLPGRSGSRSPLIILNFVVS